MRLVVIYVFLFAIVFNLWSCKPSSYFETKNSSTPINNSYTNHSQVDALIKPYKVSLDAQMDEVLVISAEEFPKEKGKPETKLGNLVADLSLEIANQLYKPYDGESIDFCLLNFGGLGTSLPKGEITKRKIFELMPFENELVVVTISESNLINLIEYLKLSGGQPISAEISFEFKENENFEEELKHLFSEDGTSEFKILTTDYLVNGGDNMNFFINPIKIEPVGIKLRDAIIQYCVEQHKKGKQLVGKLDGRISFE